MRPQHSLVYYLFVAGSQLYVLALEYNFEIARIPLVTLVTVPFGTLFPFFGVINLSPYGLINSGTKETNRTLEGVG